MKNDNVNISRHSLELNFEAGLIKWCTLLERTKQISEDNIKLIYNKSNESRLNIF